MLRILKARQHQGYRTFPLLDKEPTIAPRFRGLPSVKDGSCKAGCDACVAACPTDAIRVSGERVALDLGQCIFCNECATVCPEEAVTFTNDYRLAVRRREDLVTTGSNYRRAEALGEELRRAFGRSFRIRQVSAGGCNGCEADINVLSTVVFDLSRFGIQIVASPRHADALVLTGPVTDNMALALKKTWDAMASPRFVIAVGACAIGGGPFREEGQREQGQREQGQRDDGQRRTHSNGGGDHLPIDLYVPGCPPHPWTILDGILRLLGERGDGK